VVLIFPREGTWARDGYNGSLGTRICSTEVVRVFVLDVVSVDLSKGVKTVGTALTKRWVSGGSRDVVLEAAGDDL
jgi:hypothetical protein